MPWCGSQTSSFIWDSTFIVLSCQCICMCNYKDFLLHLNYCWIKTMSSLLFWLTVSSLPLLLKLVISWDYICIQKYRLPIGYLKFHELESLLNLFSVSRTANTALEDDFYMTSTRLWEMEDCKNLLEDAWEVCLCLWYYIHHFSLFVC
jgi:hypothetical protein